MTTDNLGSEREFFDKEYEDGNRLKLGQIYSIIHCRNDRYHELIYKGIAGKRVLEYGCGTGSHSMEIARRGGLVTGIDISEVGIAKATAAAREAGVTGADYLVMDAENMTFPDATFDLVIGEGILHHLDLDRSYSEISRVLRPDGLAVFMEPLGHNFAMRLFRHLTPSMRTEDEHPLLGRDLRAADKYFKRTNFEFFHLTSFGALAFLKTPWFFPIVRWADKVDRFLFRYIPASRLQSWYAIMLLGK
jgi:SAM-dependent methyltransferase